tara:strand:- start:458 stop:1021 length:564 start_codon:yes stop_codon:yes gene_type:complete
VGIAQICLDALGSPPFGVDDQNPAGIDGNAELGARRVFQCQFVAGARAGAQFVTQPLEAGQALHSRQQLNIVDRLGQKVVGTGFKAAHAVRRLIEGGDHDDGDMGRCSVALENLTAGKSVHLRHHHIEQDDIDVLAAANFDRLGAGGGRHNVEILGEQARLEQFHIGGNVINDEHSCSHGARPFGPE